MTESDTSVGRIRIGSSTGRAPHAPPVKIDRWRLTAPPAPPEGEVVKKKERAYCPICMAWEGSTHLGTHPYWRRVVAALARYAR